MFTTTRRFLGARLLNLVVAFTLLLPNLAAMVPPFAQPALAAGDPAALAAPAAETPPPTAPADEGRIKPTFTPQPGLIETQIPTATPIPPVQNPITLTLTVLPVDVQPGDQVTLLWQVAPWEKVNTGAELVLTLPAGLKAVLPQDEAADNTAHETDEAATSRAEVNVVRLPLEKPEGSLVLTVGEDFSGQQVVQGEVRFKETTLGMGFAPVQRSDVFQIGAEGGKATGLNGRVSVEFPQGTLQEAISLRIGKPSARANLPYSLSGNPFEITATSQAKGVEVNKFSQPYTLTVKYDGEQYGARESTLTLFYYDIEMGTWRPIPSQVDMENDVLVAQVDHLTDFDINPQDWEAARLPTLDHFQVSQYSGSATYSLPIEVPPGPGGQQPSLTVSYNSSTVDGASNRTQSSWAGMGWSIDTGYIQRNQNGTPNYFGTPYDSGNHEADDDYSTSLGWTGSDGDDTFSLVVNGQSWSLVRIPDIDNDRNTIEYRTAEESFWRVRRYHVHGTYGPYAADYSYWIAWDKTGNEYFFNANALYPAYPGTQCNSETTFMLTWQWPMMRARNVFGSELTYTYEYDTEGHYGRCSGYAATAHMAVYPSEIIYANNHYRVKFIRSDNVRTDVDDAWDDLTSNTLYMRDRLARIEIWHDPDGNFSTTDNRLIRQYVLGYGENGQQIFPGVSWQTYNTTADTPTLTSITEQMPDLGNPATLLSLPPTTFVYGDNMHLTEATNGYGGKVTFTYEADPWYENQAEWWIDHSRYQGGATNGVERLITTDPFQVFYPGQYYFIHYRATPYWATYDVGVYDGTGRYPATEVRSQREGTDPNCCIIRESAVKLSGQATKAHFYYKGSGAASYTMDSYYVMPVVTRYRVVTKTLTDLTSSPNYTLVTEYRYDAPATNDNAHSQTIASIPDHLDRLDSMYGQFRGHGMSEVVGPLLNGTRQISRTFYYQDDDRQGKEAVTMTSAQGFFDPFNSWDTASWSGMSPLIERVDGDKAITVTLGSTQQTLVRPGGSLANGEAVLVQFKLNDDHAGVTPEGILAVDSGTWGQADYLRWGLRFNPDGTLQARKMSGAGPTTQNYDLCDRNGTCGTYTLSYGKWYTLLLIQDSQGSLVRVWPSDDPANARQVVLNVTTVATNPHFAFSLKNGGAWLDAYSEEYVYSLNENLYATTLYYDAITGNSTPDVVLLKRQYRTYNPDSTTYYPYHDTRVAWTYPTSSYAYTFGDDATWVGTRVDYVYDVSEQNGTQYGNQTRTIQYSGSSSTTGWTAYRGTRSRFYPYVTNGTVGSGYTDAHYLVGLPANANTFKCAGTDPNCTTLPTANLIASTLNIYDGNSAFSQSPSQGVLAKQRKLLNCTNNDCSAAANRYYSDTAFGYDAYGNRTTTTAYTAATVETSFGSGTARINSVCYGGGGTVNGYSCTDDGYHTYPQWMRNPISVFPATSTNYAAAVNTNTTATGYTFGVPVSITDPNGAVTSATYDAFGRITSVTRPDSGGSASIEITYNIPTAPFTNNPFWTQVRQKTGTGASDYVTVRKFYNGLGQLLQVQQGGVVTSSGTKDVLASTAYDAAGRVVKGTVPVEATPWSGTGTAYQVPTFSDSPRNYTLTAYDQFGRTQSVTAPDATAQTYTYGDLTTTIYDPRNVSGWYTITRTDVWGRTVEVDPPDGPSVTYTYDELDQLKTATRGPSTTTTLAYDMAGRKLSMVDPDMGSWSYTYDALGNLLTQTDARSCTITMGYDALSRLAGKTYGASNCGSGNTNVSYTYDDTANGNKGWGRRTGMTDASGSAAWTYDLRGRMTKEIKTIGGTAYTTQWTYTLGDQPATMTYPDNELLTYTYHPQAVLNRLMSNKDDENLTSNYYLVQQSDYDASGRMDFLRLAADNLAQNPVFVEDYTYNGWTTDGGRLQRINAGTYASQASLLDLRYDYDKVGNIISLWDYKVGNPQLQSFTYDALSRLNTAYATGGTVGNYANQGYTYDSSTGNLASKAGVSYTYNDTAHKHAVTHLGGVQKYWYDANGNMTKRIAGSDTFEFVYDAENRIYQVKKNSNVLITFTYDGDGGRVKSVLNGSAIMIFVGNYYEIEQGAVRKYYYAAGQRIAWRAGSSLAFLMGDHLGSTSVSVAVAAPGYPDRQGYYPWGERRFTQGNGIPIKYQFTGQYSYATTFSGDFGLMYYNARWYDPTIGRFAQADTIIPVESQGTQAWDRYAYTNNNPVVYNDPSGHCVDPDYCPLNLPPLPTSTPTPTPTPTRVYGPELPPAGYATPTPKPSPAPPAGAPTFDPYKTYPTQVSGPVYVQGSSPTPTATATPTTDPIEVIDSIENGIDDVLLVEDLGPGAGDIGEAVGVSKRFLNVFALASMVWTIFRKGVGMDISDLAQDARNAPTSTPSSATPSATVGATSTATSTPWYTPTPYMLTPTPTSQYHR